MNGINCYQRFYRPLCALLLLLTLLTVAAASQQWSRGWQFKTDLQSLFPRDSERQLLNHASDQISDAFGDRLLLAVAAPTRELVQVAALQVESVLQGSELLVIESVADREQTGDSLLAALRKHRFALLTSEQRGYLLANEVEPLLQHAGVTLFGFSPGDRGLSPMQDPLALFASYAMQLQPQIPGELWGDQLLLTNDHGALLVFSLTIRGGSFSLAVHDQLNVLVSQLKQALSTEEFQQVQLLRSGAAFHAAESSVNARSEASTIGLGSCAGILLLFLLSFRRLQPLLLSLSSVLFGCLVAFVHNHLLYGHIHLITLVFGAGLIGVAVDYSLHYLSKRQQFDGEVRSGEVLQHILPALTLGLLTSLLGYACLFQTDLAILQQIASFSMVGLIGAWLFVVVLYPRCFRSALPSAPRWLDALASLPARGWSTLEWRIQIILVLGMLVLLGGFYQLQFSADVRLLYRPSPELLQAETTLQQHIKGPALNQFFIVRASSAEALLQAEEKFRAQALKPLLDDGVLQDYNAISRILPSRAQQAADYRLLAAQVYGPGGLSEQFMAEAGFADAEIQQLQKEFAHAAGQILSMEDWLPHVPPEYRVLWLGDVSGDYASVIALRGIADVAALAAVAEDSDNVLWVDRVADMSQLMARLSVSAAGLLALAYLVVIGLLWFWYRRAQALTLVLVPLVSTALALSLLSLAGQPIGLFHLLGCYLILGLGMDYAIFVYQSPPGSRSCLRAVLLSVATSSLSFGFLSMSSTPMVSAFGATLLLGSLCNWLLVPALHRIKTDELSEESIADAAY